MNELQQFRELVSYLADELERGDVDGVQVLDDHEDDLAGRAEAIGYGQFLQLERNHNGDCTGGVRIIRAGLWGMGEQWLPSNALLSDGARLLSGDYLVSRHPTTGEDMPWEAQAVSILRGWSVVQPRAEEAVAATVADAVEPDRTAKEFRAWVGSNVSETWFRGVRSEANINAGAKGRAFNHEEQRAMLTVAATREGAVANRCKELLGD